MDRRRLLVVLPVPEPVASKIDGLRQALGDSTIDGIGPHVTLVPPVNVRDDAFEDARSLISAAAAQPRVVSRLGPVATFAPTNPVLYLQVAEASAIGSLRDQIFRPPLSRPLSHEFVPHVTLNPSASDAQIEHVPNVTSFEEFVTFATVELLEEQTDDDGRRWTLVDDVFLGSEVVHGRGGVETRLTTTSISATHPGADLVVRAQRLGREVGSVSARADGSRVEVLSITVEEPVRGQGVGRALIGRIVALADASGRTPMCAPDTDGSVRAMLTAVGRLAND